MRWTVITFLFLSCHSWAGKVGVEVATGFHSTYGLLGYGLRYFPNKHFDLYYSAGLGLSGPVHVLGTRIYTPPVGKKCFFFIPCTPLYYIGAYYGDANGGIVTSENDGVETELEFSRGEFTGINVGNFDLFGDVFFYSVDLGYRHVHNRQTYQIKSGGDSESEESAEKALENGLSYSLSLGFLF